MAHSARFHLNLLHRGRDLEDGTALGALGRSVGEDLWVDVLLHSPGSVAGRKGGTRRSSGFLKMAKNVNFPPKCHTGTLSDSFNVSYSFVILSASLVILSVVEG